MLLSATSMPASKPLFCAASRIEAERVLEIGVGHRAAIGPSRQLGHDGAGARRLAAVAGGGTAHENAAAAGRIVRPDTVIGTCHRHARDGRLAGGVVRQRLRTEIRVDQILEKRRRLVHEIHLDETRTGLYWKPELQAVVRFRRLRRGRQRRPPLPASASRQPAVTPRLPSASRQPVVTAASCPRPWTPTL